MQENKTQICRANYAENNDENRITLALKSKE